MTDLRPTIVPKSDQLNADDLIGRTITVTVTKVALCSEADQPIAVHFEGDNGKPYKPCKSMRRVMVKVWGEDGAAFVGRRMTLYRDDGVRFGGLEVGGIRISHMSDIDRDVTMALTATRASRKPYTVKPLRDGQSRQRPATQQSGADDFPGDRPSAPKTAPALTLAQRVAAFDERLIKAPNTTKATSVWAAAEQLRTDLDRADPEELEAMTQRFNKRYAALEDAEVSAPL